MSSRYDQARADFEHLETLEQLEDQVELDSERLYLMQNPTKAQAAGMYESGIRLWFREHADEWGDACDVQDIADRHGITLSTQEQSNG